MLLCIIKFVNNNTNMEENTDDKFSKILQC